MQQPISITGLSSISPLGSNRSAIWESYLKNKHLFTSKSIKNASVPIARLAENQITAIEYLRQSESKYKHLDDSVLYAIITARNAISESGWNQDDDFGINIGSSRGATSLFENYHQQFLEKGNTETLTSPTTTLGNISSWVAHDLQTKGPEISHSITCSTALHAMLNGIAWLQSGLSDKFLVGGSEAALTDFTIAQMQALKIYSKDLKNEFPCRALDMDKKRNSMILGEGAAMACLELGKTESALATISEIGYATEPLQHNISISTDADCFQRSMHMAIKKVGEENIDAIVMHAPGTIKGDLAEYNAIQKIFCNKIPFLTTNKWKVGHTFGASGMLSVELAILMLQHQQTIEVPYISPQTKPDKLNNILVNAVGFGGNAVSILLSK
ncbi:beta-ketoacyl synthase N-terminal-like domain-containing protein [Spongiivirga citrea]|uniref:Beta-ketoacyl synthase n=1 Tax=Spongiivirga citrea TaxID=1481457 RepID=A0A6M0CJG6_9FLAO|nr:beta-ketoacyl synthase N-terminal-like domain-containing protein [Spongiivirga citrea]NER17123.1 beta-ketoacyl synthase [Spongiivirga citrea]